MKRFVIQLSVFLLVFFLLDKSLILLRDRLPEKEIDKRLEYVINGQINADVIIIGSSRGARDVVASKLSDSLKTTAYNLSYPGSNIEFHDYLLTELLRNSNKKPRLVVLVVDDYTELIDEPSITFRSDRLYPLVKYAPVRDKLCEHKEKNKLLSDMFVIHQLSISSFDPRRKRFSSLDTLYNDGSMYISWRSKKFDGRYDSTEKVYTGLEELESKVRSLQNLVSNCEKNGIRILFAYAPNFYRPTCGFQDRLMDFAGKDSHLMMYDTTNHVYYDSNYFYDRTHLNRIGADVFTGEIVEFIQKNNLLQRG